jgi:hypothetical protein
MRHERPAPEQRWRDQKVCAFPYISLGPIFSSIVRANLIFLGTFLNRLVWKGLGIKKMTIERGRQGISMSCCCAPWWMVMRRLLWSGSA